MIKRISALLLGPIASVPGWGVALAADTRGAGVVPSEYVRVCSAFGAGFFTVPGTDTCLRVSGRARFEAGYAKAYSRSGQNGDVSQFVGLGRLNLDARTQTSYGTLRAFVRFDLSSRSGPVVAAATRQRIGEAFPALGVDTFGRTQQYVNVDKAFIQFAGLTAGRAASFYDFYAHDFEMITGSLGSNSPSTNLLAYTARTGNGFSATLSVEDPTFRWTPVFGNAATAANINTSFNNVFATSAFNLTPVIATNAAGVPVGLAFTDVTMRNRMPDFVGSLRYDAAWGSAQLSAAAHQISTGNAAFAVGFNGASLPAGSVIAPRVQAETGWAVQGGVKVNLPFLAAGDAVYLQGSYGEGAQLYTGYSRYIGSYTGSLPQAQGSPFSMFFSEATVNPLNGRLDLSSSWTVVGSLLHYWTPQWRSTAVASYGQMSFNKADRITLGLLNMNGFAPAGGALGNPVTNPAAFALTSTLRDTNQMVTGANLIWSPVRDLDIGVEALYARVALQNGRTVDLNKNVGVSAVAGLNAAGQPVTAAGVPIRTVSSADTVQIRMRVQRDF